jgi:hypothetical protein
MSVALHADEVVVVLVADQLEARRAALEAPLGDDAAVLEDPQRAVHRRRPDARVAHPHLAEELLGRDVPTHRRERVEDELAARGGLEVVAHDVLTQSCAQHATLG